MRIGGLIPTGVVGPHVEVKPKAEGIVPDEMSGTMRDQAASATV